ncbi:uncharacterized protein LOC128078370 isoform X3 [Tympanuchus pallidicinctus]|uniref:uncharacterized protein LOC128078370 isoform X3 n=1 Tax=Tympanuchus pallidicinctus TaxID=109042 RepID=UPI002286E7F4|nr:uncharacterized protein LOC128078370 isoform X3 [Tympanuchus pallidicinctus]
MRNPRRLEQKSPCPQKTTIQCVIYEHKSHLSNSHGVAFPVCVTFKPKESSGAHTVYMTLTGFIAKLLAQEKQVSTSAFLPAAEHIASLQHVRLRWTVQSLPLPPWTWMQSPARISPCCHWT